jgi:hypothetical protein
VLLEERNEQIPIPHIQKYEYWLTPVTRETGAARHHDALSSTRREDMLTTKPRKGRPLGRPLYPNASRVELS